MGKSHFICRNGVFTCLQDEFLSPDLGVNVSSRHKMKKSGWGIPLVRIPRISSARFFKSGIRFFDYGKRLVDCLLCRDNTLT